VPPWAIAILVCSIVAVDLLVVWALLRGLAFTWNGVARAHPPVDPAPDAVRKDFQSFKLGIYNLGLAVHVAVDDRYLHLLPSRALRWGGAGACSVPWEAVTPLGPRAFKAFAVKVAGQTLTGPRWALALSAPANNDPECQRSGTRSS